MGVINQIVGDSKNKDKYAKLDESDLLDTLDAETAVRFVEVRSQNDLINAKEELQDGNMIIADIAYIDSNGVSFEQVARELGEATSMLDGDIIHKKRNDLVIATPTDISIDRDPL